MQIARALPQPLDRGMAIGIAIALSLLVLTPTASADVAPASTGISAASTDLVFVYSGLRIRCTTADLRGTTPARGMSALSFEHTYGIGGRCDANGIAATATCRGRSTFRITAFSAPSASGTIALDGGFDCTIDFLLSGCRWSFAGPQANVGDWDFTNTTQVLNTRAVRVAATDTGGTCSGDTLAGTRRGTANFTATYSPSTRLTLS